MRRLVPHALYVVALICLAVVGYLWNLQSVAVFAGTFAALCTDPLLLLMAAGIGALSPRPPVLLAISMAGGVVFPFYTAPLGAELTSFVTFTRVCVVVAVALAAIAVLLLAIRAKPA